MNADGEANLPHVNQCAACHLVLGKLLLGKAEVFRHEIDDASDILPRDAVRLVTLFVVPRSAKETYVTSWRTP